MLHNFQPFAVWQSHIGQAQVKVPVFKVASRLRNRTGSLAVQSHPAHIQFQQIKQIWLIINDQYSWTFHRLFRSLVRILVSG